MPTSPDSLTKDLNAAPPPKGFRVTVSREGMPAIAYRTIGMTGLAIFFTGWLVIWLTGCGFLTYQAFFAHSSIDQRAAWLMIPFWAGAIGAITYALWYFRSVTTFTFHPDRLLVERSFFIFRRRRTIILKEIKAVRQIKDGGEGEDSFPTWGLVVICNNKIKLLSRQRIEQSNWLGPIVARYAGVDFEAWQSKPFEAL